MQTYTTCSGAWKEQGLSHFAKYFQETWMNRWNDWALCARNDNYDTGDQKGEAYNRFLQGVVFGGVQNCEMHVVFHNLHLELQQAAMLLRSPDLIKARLQAYEHGQRRHDPNRLKRSAVTLEDRLSTDQEQPPIVPAAASPTTASLQPVSSLVAATDASAAALVATSSLPSFDELDEVLYQHDPVAAPVPTSSELATLLADAGIPAAAQPHLARTEPFHCGKNDCKAQRHSSCCFGYCKRCCVTTMGFCGKKSTLLIIFLRVL